MHRFMLVAATLMLPVGAANAIASPADTLVVPAPPVDRIDVAYDDLAAGHARRAIQRIETGGMARDGDPSALINMGSAHAMLGEESRASALYRAAVASTVQYDLQLADGTWLDSRRAARLALSKLAKGERLALK